ncbi:MAG: ornithine cyclodeaminase family protein, partial [Lysinibacillus sp.]|nr:ornithine cyclodeaminase family protein [Lysinibacillus sp.]
MIILSEKQIQSIYKMEDALRDVEEMLIAKQKNYVQAP